MIKRFKKHIEQKFPFLKKEKILVAISGGVDSVVLTHLLSELEYHIALAHCNFKLRGAESDKDEIFVENLGKQLKIKTFTTSFDTQKEAQKRGISIQMMARELRYQWFEELQKEHSYSFVLTAHQKNDILETFLLNAVRGTGLLGLVGIPEQNGTIIRPLLPFSREEIKAFAVENQLLWREDQSNASVKYSRNKLRHQVIPILQEINVGLDKTFERTIENLKETQSIVEDAVAKVKKEVVQENGDSVCISIAKLNKLACPKAYLFELLKSYSFTEWNDVARLLEGQTGKQVFSKTHRILKNREELLVTPLKSTIEEVFYIEKGQEKIEIPILMSFEYQQLVFDGKTKETPFSEWLLDTDFMLFDAEKLTFPLELRKWQQGDYFYPIGMKGKKKISKYFKDEKFSQYEKEQVWLLCSGDAVVWIVGHRMDERFKVTAETSELFKIKLTV
ncbi:MAG: tRNA lysidine(34) synthetase TilS [Flavobacteriaceae bacterium]|nr:tRNA lysidine(34) synthetase TilS [Flavobacteriaceae bacterium]